MDSIDVICSSEVMHPMNILKYILLLAVMLNSLHDLQAQQQFLVNSLGDTIKTGVPIAAQGKVIHRDSISAPQVLDVGKPKVVPTNTNVHEAGIPKVVEAKPYKPNLDSLLFVLVNSIGDTVQTGVPIPTIGNVVPTNQPQPIPALAPRFKDNVINNMQYLDVDQGMASSYVFSILEDKRGNLWFGTDGG
ncbi:MAG: hypothetical protein HOB26_00825, partial [Flavobacteriales bacterium]|nr:hypothetical protein [Flavobacteriales bacterium]